MKYAATAIVFAAFSLFTPGLALPATSVEIDQALKFGWYKIPQCARDGESHVESHGSANSGDCFHMDWARSFAFNDEESHNQCSFAFYSDWNCTEQVPTPQPQYNASKIDNFYTDCFDDLSSLNNGKQVLDNLVENVNVRVTCS